MNQLILGGARSGKSRYAETLAQATGKQLIYLATGEPGDAEMQKRIAIHREGRASQWQTVEEPIALAERLVTMNEAGNAVVVDCLTLWLSNCLTAGVLNQQKDALMDLLPQLVCDLYLVSNEVGSGVVPLGELSREFVDQSGWLHQRLAEHCERVTLVVAGLPMTLK